MLGVDDAALAIIAAGAISSAGALYANKKNIENQQYINDLALAQSDSNNALQIDLANTAHQREVRDLRAAGLNPILSAGGHGSAVPSLQQARLDAAQVENPLSGLANSASQLSRYFGQSYKAGLENQIQDIKTKKQDIKNKKIEEESLKNFVDQQRYSLENQEEHKDLDFLQTLIEKEALSDLVCEYDRDGTPVGIDRDSEYFHRYKQGLLTDQVIKARQSARNLYSDILSGVNSAKGVADTFSHFMPVKPGSFSKGSLKNAKEWAEMIYNATH